MNIWTILEQKNNFTDSEAAAADYLLKNRNKVMEITPSLICRSCYISMATLYRLLNKLDCQGFTDFKLRLQADQVHYQAAQEQIDYDFPFHPEADFEQMAEALHKDYEQTLQTTRNLFNAEEFEQAIGDLNQARRIAVFTSAGNIPFALNFRFQMMEIGRDILVPVDEYEQKLAASTMTKDDFAILITFGGRGAHNEHIAEILHCNQVPLLLISSTDLNKSARYAKYQIFLCPAENHYRKISSFSTRQSLLYILDLLYCCCFNSRYTDNLTYKLEAYYKISGGTEEELEKEELESSSTLP